MRIELVEEGAFMATAYLSPGVYVEEVDRGSKPIEASERKDLARHVLADQAMSGQAAAAAPTAVVA